MKNKVDLSSRKLRGCAALLAVGYAALVLMVGVPRAQAHWYSPPPGSGLPGADGPTWHLILTPFGWWPGLY